MPVIATSMSSKGYPWGPELMASRARRDRLMEAWENSRSGKRLSPAELVAASYQKVRAMGSVGGMGVLRVAGTGGRHDDAARPGGLELIYPMDELQEAKQNAILQTLQLLAAMVAATGQARRAGRRAGC